MELILRFENHAIIHMAAFERIRKKITMNHKKMQGVEAYKNTTAIEKKQQPNFIKRREAI